MTCCSECFQDVTIIEFIGNNHTNGRCGTCGKENAFTIEPDKLSHLFYPFLGLVNESNQGERLDRILNDLFEIFNPQVRSPHQLIENIIGAEFTSKEYTLKQSFDKSVCEWEEFKDELKHQNRFFPKNSLYSSLFGLKNNDFFQIIEQLKTEYDTGDVFYRARISDTILNRDNMGMPPKGYATYGRANPVGISLLYLANNQERRSQFVPLKKIDLYL